MKKLVLVALTTCVFGVIAGPPVSTAQEPQPSVSVSQRCGGGFFILEMTITGLAPGEVVTFSIGRPGEPPLSGEPVAADATGRLRVALSTRIGGLHIVSITSPFSAMRSVTLACVPPVVTLTAYCDEVPSRYGFVAGITGLAPNASFVGGYEVLFVSGLRTSFSTTLTASSAGTFGVQSSFPEPIELVSVFAEVEGQRIERSLERPCLEPALPTLKEQCKNGGWKSYGVFKNQGDCVSFVATGGKNPPSGP